METQIAITAVEPVNDYGVGGDLYDDRPPQPVEPEHVVPDSGLKKKAKGPWGDHVGRDSDSDQEKDTGDQVLSSAVDAYSNIKITAAEPTGIFSPSTTESAPRRDSKSNPVRERKHKTEKERMAEQLFLGGGDTTSNQKRRKKKKKIIKSSGSPQKKKPKA